jgi:hypothetical protein
MRDWTGVEVQEERTRLEHEAAAILGFMLFEYSRLDMELGLFLSWSDDGSLLENLTRKMGSLNFSKRLEYLQKSVTSKFDGNIEVLGAYAAWISEAHSIRELRNELFHGRWCIDPIAQRVVNVVGLPNSPDQKSRPHTIEELEEILNRMRHLRVQLRELRSSCPV